MDNETLSYKYIFTDLADSRTKDWFLISSPIPMTLIILFYLYFVKVFGPNYMKDKEPYELRRVMMIYNILQIAANLYLFKETANVWRYFNWNCQPINYSNSPAAIWEAWGCYLYFLNKLSDITDTVFFVLRKKYRQITFLHVFHHAMMIFASWTMTKYFPGGHGTFVGLLNTFVHILLYTYYYLAAFGPRVQKYLFGWKKYLTRIQLIQFCLISIHSIQVLVFDCGYPKMYVLLSLPNTIFFYYLFNDFYQNSYTKVVKTTGQNGTPQKVKAA